MEKSIFMFILFVLFTVNLVSFVLLCWIDWFHENVPHFFVWRCLVGDFFICYSVKNIFIASKRAEYHVFFNMSLNHLNLHLKKNILNFDILMYVAKTLQMLLVPWTLGSWKQKFYSRLTINIIVNYDVLWIWKKNYEITKN